MFSTPISRKPIRGATAIVSLRQRNSTVSTWQCDMSDYLHAGQCYEAQRRQQHMQLVPMS